MNHLQRLTPVTDMCDWIDHPLGSSGTPGMIRVEDFVRDGRYVVRADLPGIDPAKDLRIEVRGDILSLRAQRSGRHHDKGRQEIHYGSFTRSLRLPPECLGSDLRATYDAGVLEVSAPMIEVPATVTVPVQLTEEA